MHLISIAAYAIIVIQFIHALPVLETEDSKTAEVSPHVSPRTKPSETTFDDISHIQHLVIEQLSLDDVPSALLVSKSWTPEILHNLKQVVRNSNESTINHFWKSIMKHGDVRMTRLFIESGRLTQDQLDEAIVVAVETQNAGMFDLLVRSHHFEIANDIEAMETAVANNDIRTAAWLLHENRIDPESLKTQFYEVVLANDYATMVRLLLTSKDIDPGALDNFAILIATMKGFVKTAKILLADSRVDPSANNNMAILLASVYGHDLDMVKLLLEDPRVDPSDENSFSFSKACEAGHVEIVDELIRDGRINVSADDNQALKSAAFLGHKEIVDRIISHPQFQVTEGVQDALNHAKKRGHLEIIEMLSAIDD